MSVILHLAMTQFYWRIAESVCYSYIRSVEFELPCIQYVPALAVSYNDLVVVLLVQTLLYYVHAAAFSFEFLL